MISRDNILDLEARQQIFEFIKKNPCLHQREISRRLNIPKSTLIYHIRFLRKLGIINESKDGKNKYYYVVEQLSVKEKQVLNLFRKKIPCKIFLYMLFSFACSQAELSRELELSYTTVTRNIKKMVKVGVLEEAPMEKDRVYPFPNGTRKYIALDNERYEKFYRRTSGEIVKMAWAVLIAHKDELIENDFLQSYIDYAKGLGFKSLKKDGNLSKRYKLKVSNASVRFRRIDYHFDSVINTVNDIFRPPFCA